LLLLLLSRRHVVQGHELLLRDLVVLAHIPLGSWWNCLVVADHSSDQLMVLLHQKVISLLAARKLLLHER
jgi:hypothetical protein